MPTTRSQGRHEPLQRLETPPKRQRKQKPRRPLLAPRSIFQEPRLHTLSLSPEPEDFIKQVPELVISPIPAVSYRDASTQTEQVIILTQMEAADLKERAAPSGLQKRSRDDEDEDDHASKRRQFSTPQQNKPNNLWMFGERANGDHPRTAPSKSFAASSLRRPVRGPLSKRTNAFDSPRHRGNVAATLDRHAGFDSIKPIEPELKKQDVETSANESQKNGSTITQTQQHADTPQTPRRSLFGSLRGMVNKGWDLASSLTPLAAKPVPHTETEPLPVPGQVNYPHIQVPTDEGTTDDMFNRIDEKVHDSRLNRKQPPADPDQRSSRYDHLHYIPATTESLDKALNGEIEPQQNTSPPPSPASRLKAQNPQLSDATIESILRKRERKAAMDEEKYGPQPAQEATKVAPLFGPDSHYARGTVDPRFLPSTSLHGSSKKRKLESINGQIPQPRNGGFGIDDNYLDVDMEVENVDSHAQAEEDVDETPPAKRHRSADVLPLASAAPVTPRSALRKPGATGSIGRKSVAFGTSISRDIRGHYGPAGQYKGSTFADELPDDSRSVSSVDHTDVISPTTRLNTFTNSGKRPVSIRDNLGASIPAIDFTLRDPNDETWRPSLANPRPGAFRVPDIDEEDPDESMSDFTPEQPQTPRMSHAELPGAPSTNGTSSFNESSIFHESTELALDKARSQAEKYKPKSSSRLSEVSRARSRSTSPDAEEGDDNGQLLTKPPTTALGDSLAPAVKPIGAPPQPFVERELDNITKGPDGMTDFEREHQYDEWAATLEWDAPQTYEEAGTGSAFIHNLIRKNWTDEDSKRSELFWAREFDEVDRAMEDARMKGQRLTLVTGMEDIEGY